MDMDRMERSGSRPQYAQERLRYQILEYVYLQAGDDCERRVGLEQLAEEAQLSPIKTAQAVQYLVERGFLDDSPPGPLRVCLTAEGLAYIRKDAGMRRSVRSRSG